MELRYCNGCETDLPATDEYFASRTDRGRIEFQSKCRVCQKEYRKKHYEKNKQKYIDKAAAYRKETVKWFRKYKKTLECRICGEDRWWVLDFHHRDASTKEGTVSEIVRSSSKKAILKEINKCDVLCANCHRDLHYYADNA